MGHATEPGVEAGVVSRVRPNAVLCNRQVVARLGASPGNSGSFFTLNPREYSRAIIFELSDTTLVLSRKTWLGRKLTLM